MYNYILILILKFCILITFHWNLKDEPILLRSAVPAAIRNVAVRKNYGIEKEGSYFPVILIFL